MLEVYEQSNGDYVYVLPRGGKYIPNLITHIDKQTLKNLDQCASLWPLENSEIVSYIRENVASHPIFNHWVACETSFFSTMPETASSYALPGSIPDQTFMRYGANGFFHQYVAEKYPDSERIVSICLNSHPDVAAILNGQAIDSSSGYSLLEGLPGNTTCGEIDPSIVVLLAENGFTPNQIEEELYFNSGWQALTGKKSFFTPSAMTANKEISLAREMLLRMLVKSTGSMLASLGGANRIVIGCEKKQLLSEIQSYMNKILIFSAIRIDPIEIKRKEVVKFILEKTQQYQSMKKTS